MYANVPLAVVRRADVAIVARRRGRAFHAAGDRRALAGSVDAHVIAGARMPVTAGVRIVGVGAAGRRIARIVRAHIPIVAIRRRTRNAGAAVARISCRAGTSVAARQRVVGVAASNCRIAEIIRAHIVVIAIGRRSGDAAPARAGVIRRAGVAIAARTRVIGVHAAASRITRIVRADISIVAIQRRARNATSAGAGVIGRAGVTVTARTRIVDMHATAGRVARIVRTSVSVITIWRRSGNAASTRTRVIRRACVSITARIGVVDVRAAGGWIAGIVSADVAVVTVRSGPWNAVSARARVVRRASATVAARIVVVRINAHAALAVLGRANVAVIAIGGCDTTDAAVRRAVTTSSGTHVVVRATQAIITGVGIVRVYAPGGGIAAIRSAHVAIIAV